MVGGVAYHVVQVDPRRSDVRLAVATAAGGPGAGESWSGIIGRVRPGAAVTGTHFSTTSLIPVGTLVSEGRRLNSGAVGTAFVYSPGRGAAMISCAYGRPCRVVGWDLMVRSGPRLLVDGKTTLWPAGEGFRDPGLFTRKRRAAIGLTASGKVLIVATNRPILLRTLAAHMHRLGAVQAMALDGGSSAGIYHRGKSWVVPARRLTNLLVVYDSVAAYRAARPRLTPGGWVT